MFPVENAPMAYYLGIMLHHFFGGYVETQHKKKLMAQCLRIVIYACGKERIEAEEGELKDEAEAIYDYALDTIFWPEKYGVELYVRERFRNVLRRMVQVYYVNGGMKRELEENMNVPFEYVL